MRATIASHPADAILPLDFGGVAKPGVMISNAFPEARLRPGGTLAAIAHVLERHPFFEALQTAEVSSAEERHAIRARLSGTRRAYTYTLTRGLADAGLNLSSVDPLVRRRSCERVVQYFRETREAGAGVVALISGARPAPPMPRADGLRALAESLATIAPAARDDGIELVIEPLDYDAHKRATLGTTAEAVELCQQLASGGWPLALCIDTAHVLLNGEDPLAAVTASRAYLTEFHFCNAVTDRTHPLFGDRHLPFGRPGVLGVEEVGGIMAGLFRTGYLSAMQRPRVYVEILKSDDIESDEVVANGEELLKSAWRHARALLR